LKLKQTFLFAALASGTFLAACHNDQSQPKAPLKCDPKTLAGCSDEQKASIKMSGDSLESSRIHIGEGKKPSAPDGGK